jgi:hypothetical protein
MKAGEEPLEALAGRLRARVAEGRYREAQGALREYCGALRKAVAALPRGDPGVRRLEAEWGQLLGHTRRRVLAGRAHAGVRLGRLAEMRRSPRFYGAGLPPRRTREWLA